MFCSDISTNLQKKKIEFKFKLPMNKRELEIIIKLICNITNLQNKTAINVMFE